MVTEATCPTPHLRGGDFYFAARLVSWMRVCGARAPGHVCARVRGAHIRASQTEETDVRRFVSHLRSGGQCGRRGEPRASESLSRKQVLETEAGSESAAAASPLTRSAAWRSESGRGTGRGARATPAVGPLAPRGSPARGDRPENGLGSAVSWRALPGRAAAPEGPRGLRPRPCWARPRLGDTEVRQRLSRVTESYVFCFR